MAIWLAAGSLPEVPNMVTVPIADAGLGDTQLPADLGQRHIGDAIFGASLRIGLAQTCA
jgi:hypothetical protein